jgi:hypothetical protein
VIPCWFGFEQTCMRTFERNREEELEEEEEEEEEEIKKDFA